MFREDLAHWVGRDSAVAIRLMNLVEAIIQDPLHGIGKPEPLRYSLEGSWSRRLTYEHRLVYVVKQESIYFLQARFHY